MGTQVLLDDDVRNEIVKRAIKLEMVFSPVNDVLRAILGLTKEEKSGGAYPRSGDAKVSGLLEGLKGTVMSVSPGGMRLGTNGRRWVSDSNVVTVTVQEARAHNLRITVFGRREEFAEMKGSLDIRDDMAGYSRFVVDNESQLPSAIKVIRQSHDFKKARGRLRSRQ